MIIRYPGCCCYGQKFKRTQGKTSSACASTTNAHLESYRCTYRKEMGVNYKESMSSKYPFIKKYCKDYQVL